VFQNISLLIEILIYTQMFKTKNIQNKNILSSSCSLRSSNTNFICSRVSTQSSQIKKNKIQNKAQDKLAISKIFNINLTFSNKHNSSNYHNLHKIIKCLSIFIIHITHLRFLLIHIHRHLTLLPEDSCIEISILRPAFVILLAMKQPCA